MKNPWIIKAGGELLANDATKKKIVATLASLAKKNPVIFVHGGGTQIEAELTKNKVPISFVGGRRVTSWETMKIVERVLSGQVNKDLVGLLTARGTKAVGLSCRDAGIIQGRPLPHLGRAGRPVLVNPELLWTLLKNGFMPVVSSVASDKAGQALNINADDAASALAIHMKASHLVFVTDVPGVFDKFRKRIHILKTSAIDSLIENGIIKGGMIPKAQSARDALKKGVGEVNIISGYKGIHLDQGTRIVL